MMLGSSGGAAGCLALVGLAFALGATARPWHKMLALAGVFGYLFAFGCGLAGGPWLVNGEIYPTRVRGVANSAAAASNWLANYVVAETFLSVIKLVGASATFFALSAVCALGGLWLWRSLPETAGCTIEQIEAIFRPSAAAPACARAARTPRTRTARRSSATN